MRRRKKKKKLSSFSLHRLPKTYFSFDNSSDIYFFLVKKRKKSV